MASPTSRLSYIDWMRGFICILMFQAHGYASWLSPELQTTRFYRLSQILGTVPAPSVNMDWSRTSDEQAADQIARAWLSALALHLEV